MNDHLGEERIFHTARRIADEELRTEYLEQVCQGNAALLSRIDALLAAESGLNELLMSEDRLPDTETSGSVDLADECIGPYKLLQQIGEGGMGTVFMAEQTRPVTRRVALKIIKAGMDSKSVIARFEAERQALAMMDHPNIARVLDAGTIDDGRPYFVMELVKGIPITEYCDENKLAIRERLELFIQVCQAVQHAHQKGIIHRDIKPSNVLVAKYDDQPVPKVIDFGVAKAISQRLTEKTMFTQYGQIVGTLEYMSPEQAQFNQLDVDTRSDIYSLGVLLYELLTGETPFDGSRLRSSAFEEVLRILREEEPPRPSQRITAEGKIATSISEARASNPQKLGTFLRGDLDWIVMRAMDKDRSRRYQSASNFADDLHNYLEDGNVNAAPPSPAYRLKKYFRRNRTSALIGGALFAAMLVAMCGLGWGWYLSATAVRDREATLNELKRAQSQLSEANGSLQSALEEWRHELIDRGLDAAFRGDLVEAESLANRVKLAGAPEEWRFLLLGLAHLLRSEHSESHEILKKAYELAPKNLAVASAYTMSLVGGGETMDQDLWQNLMLEIEKLPPNDEYEEYDKLLQGWTQIYGQSGVATKALGSLVEKRPTWPIARVFLSVAQTHESLETANQELAKTAFENAESAEKILGQIPLVLVAKLWNLTVQISFVSDESSRAVLLESVANDIAEKLAFEKDAWASGIVQAMHWDVVGNDERSLSIWKKIRGGGTGPASRVPFFERVNYDWRELEPLSDEEIRRAPFVAIAKAVFLALDGEKEVALSVYEKLNADGRSLSTRTDSLQILLAMGEDERARKKARVLLQTNGYDSHLWTNRERLEYLASEYTRGSAEKLVASVRGSTVKLCRANYLIGLRSLANEDVTKAVRYFRSCVSLKQFSMFDRQMARTLIHLFESEGTRP